MLKTDGVKVKISGLVLGGGTLLSLYIVLIGATLIITQGQNLSNSFVGSDAAKLMFLGSPLIFMLAAFSTWTSCRLNTRLWIRISLATINGIGVIVAGYFTLVLVGLGMLGPINPG